MDKKAPPLVNCQDPSRRLAGAPPGVVHPGTRTRASPGPLVGEVRDAHFFQRADARPATISQAQPTSRPAAAPPTARPSPSRRQLASNLYSLATGVLDKLRIAQFIHQWSRASPWFGSRGE